MSSLRSIPPRFLCWFCAAWVATTAVDESHGQTPSRKNGSPLATGTLVASSQSLSGGVVLSNRLAHGFDAGDSYAGPRGPRRLLRMTGAIAVRTSADDRRADVLARITAKGAIAERYSLELLLPQSIAVLSSADPVMQQRSREPGAMDNMVASLRRTAGVVTADPVFVDPSTGLWRVTVGELIIKLRGGVDPARYFGTSWARVRSLGGTPDQFVLSMDTASSAEILAEVGRRVADRDVEWAEPNFLCQGVCLQNDTYYPNQWHLNNSGQGGGSVDADIDAPEAWGITRGTNTVVVAVLDTGIQTGHPDLAPSLATNTNEIPGNSVDDDNNGYPDDVCGWDFYTGYSPGNNDPNPKVNFDKHGTPCAGCAVARGNNSIGVVSPAYLCSLLPVRVGESTDDSGHYTYYIAGMAEAIYYAAGRTKNGLGTWRGADVLSISLSMSYDLSIDNALTWASSSGRNSKGCAIFVATGNGASGYGWYSVDTSGLSSGNAYIEFEYYKDLAGVAGNDRVWIGNVVLPDSAHTRVRFDTAGMPVGWSGGGDSAFTIADDSAHSFGTGRYVARSGTPGHSQNSILRTATFTLVPGNEFSFRAWVSSEIGTSSVSYPPVGDDGDWLFVWVNIGGSWKGWAIDAGIPGNRRNFSGATVSSAVGYPASHANTIAVGAATDFDYRSDYSQYGTGLDFVSPSGGGMAGIYTTDRTGANGYVSGDYNSGFGGTSAATPVAAGVAALLLSRNPDLTAAQVRAAMQSSCDKIGGVVYTDEWNTYYGYGRVNAHRALLAITNAWVDFAYSGLEWGTLTRPFNTLAEGVSFVVTGSVVHVKAGTTSAPNDVNKLLDVQAEGGDVTVGAP